MSDFDGELKELHRPINDRTVLLLPAVEESELPFLAVSQPSFSEPQFYANWSLITSLLDHVDVDHITDEQVKKAFGETTDFVTRLVSHSGRMIPQLRHAPSVEETLLDQLPFLQTFNPGENLNRDTIQLALLDFFSATKGNTAIISPSHVSTYYELKAALQISGESGRLPADNRIGLVVFDEHTDFYVQSDENLPGEYPPQKPDFSQMPEGKRQKASRQYYIKVLRGPMEVEKRNFLLHLLEENIIDSCVIVGPSHEQMRVATKKPRPFQQNNLTHAFYVKHQDQIRLVGLADYINDGSIDRNAFLTAIQGHIANFRDRGITNVVTSIDIDVLNPSFGYTGFDYNPISAIVHLGQSDISSQVTALEDDILFQRDMDYRAGSITKLLRNLMRGTAGTRKVKSKSLEGIPAGLIGQAIDTIKYTVNNYGLEMGIILPNGQFIGDVVEVAGYDYAGRTGKVAAGLTTRLINM